MDVNEIRKWHSIFKPNNELFEIRILGNKTYSAYFNDVDKAINQILKYEDSQIYFTVNNINEACSSRNQYGQFMLVQGTATSKNDIIKRVFIPIDIDVDRPSGVCSTDEEKEYAHKKAIKVYRFLRENGFAEPIICDSSSGYHIYYPVDMESNSSVEVDIKRFYEVLSNIFTDERVKIDKQVGDANRIMRLPGTWSRKGRSTDERPHRMAKILKYPTEIHRMSREDICRFIDKYEIKENNKENSINYYNGEKSQFDLRKFIEENNIEVDKEVPWGNGGTKFVLKECPFDSSHKSPDSAIFLSANGAISFLCFHNSCSSYTWRDLRLKFDPHAYDKKEYEKREIPIRQYPSKQWNSKPKYEIKEENEELGKKWLSMSDIKKINLSDIETIKTGLNELDKAIGGLAMGELSILSGSNACVDCDTEFFNGKEWKKISEYQYGDMVLQYNYDGSANLVQPLRYIKELCQQLYLIKSKMGVNQCVSEDHNIVYCTSKGHLQKKQVKDLIKMHNDSEYGFNGRFYTTFKYNGSGIDLTDAQIRVMCAVICDGSFKTNYKDKSVVKVNLKKKRKKDRLEYLLKEANIDYLKKQYNPKDTEYNVYIFKSPRIEKEFGAYWYNCTSSQLKVITEEVLFWDGSVENQSFSQNSKKTIDFIQFAFASIGKRSSIYCDNRIGQKHSKNNYVYKNINYTLHICNNNMVSIQNRKNKVPILKYKTKDGYKYCFTVPSGMLVLRRGGNINITSNCGKSSWINQLIINVIQQDYKVGLWSGELQPRMLKIWISLCAAGKRNVVKSQYNERYYVPDEINNKIDEWMNGKLFIYNNDYSNKWEQIFNDLNELLKQGVKLFVLDNLFSLDIDIFDGDKNNKQKELVIQLCNFVKKNNIHILLVAHPRKSLGFLRKNDISGSSDIMNAASNIFICHRVNTDFIKLGKEFFGASKIDSLSGYGNVIEVCKNRLYGIDGLMVGMYYDLESRRFKNTPDEDIVYGWEENIISIPNDFAEKTYTDSYVSSDYKDVPY